MLFLLFIFICVVAFLCVCAAAILAALADIVRAACLCFTWPFRALSDLHNSRKSKTHHESLLNLSRSAADYEAALMSYQHKLENALWKHCTGDYRTVLSQLYHNHLAKAREFSNWRSRNDDLIQETTAGYTGTPQEILSYVREQQTWLRERTLDSRTAERSLTQLKFQNSLEDMNHLSAARTDLLWSNAMIDEYQKARMIEGKQKKSSALTLTRRMRMSKSFQFDDEIFAVPASTGNEPATTVRPVMAQSSGLNGELSRFNHALSLQNGSAKSDLRRLTCAARVQKSKLEDELRMLRRQQNEAKCCLNTATHLKQNEWQERYALQAVECDEKIDGVLKELENTEKIVMKARELRLVDSEHQRQLASEEREVRMLLAETVVTETARRISQAYEERRSEISAMMEKLSTTKASHFAEVDLEDATFHYAKRAADVKNARTVDGN